MPVASGENVVRALKRAGFVVDRIAGSHHILVYPNDPTRIVTVPVHSGAPSSDRRVLASKSSGSCCSRLWVANS